MLGLKLPTDRHWVDLVRQDLREVLIDHAFCEQKAASNAISLIVMFPEKSELVTAMAQIAQEEMQHFEQVHAHILKRGWVLGPERKDSYVNDLLKFVRKGQGKDTLLMDRLLFAAMVEARSCERFRVLEQEIGDVELAAFYHELMISEANHYTTFLQLARRYLPVDEVNARWQAFLDYEAEIIQRYNKAPTMHG